MTHVTLPNDLQDVLRNHLPSHLSNVLREELERGQKALDALEDANTTIQKQCEELGQHKRLSTRKKEVAAEAAELARQEAALTKERNALELFKAEHQLYCERQLNNWLQQVLAGLVRNTEWRESVLEFEHNLNGQGGASATPKTTARTAE